MEPSLVPDTLVSPTTLCVEEEAANLNGWTTRNDIPGPRLISFSPDIGLEGNTAPVTHDGGILVPRVLAEWDNTNEVSQETPTPTASNQTYVEKEEVSQLDNPSPAPPVIKHENHRPGKNKSLCAADHFNGRATGSAASRGAVEP